MIGVRPGHVDSFACAAGTAAIPAPTMITERIVPSAIRLAGREPTRLPRAERGRTIDDDVNVGTVTS